MQIGICLNYFVFFYNNTIVAASASSIPDCLDSRFKNNQLNDHAKEKWHGTFLNIKKNTKKHNEDLEVKYLYLKSKYLFRIDLYLNSN